MKRTSIIITFLSILLLTACVNKQTEGNIVTVTIEPQRYFAEKIAGDKFKINCVVPAGQSPETYDPTPQQMIQVGKSIAYLRIGPIGFEQAWMDKIRENNPNLEIFDTSEGMKLLTDAEEDAHAHDHAAHDHDAHAGEDAHHHHHHGGVDPHIWSSIAGAKVVAWNTLNAFIALDPDNTEYFWKNYNELVDEIDKTETEIKQLLDPLTDRTFIIYHPALTYFANEFNLTQLCIEMDGKEPSPAQLKMLVETARENNARVVFIQQEFDQKNAELIAKETGCKLTVINPLAYDWSKEMIHIAKALADGQTH
nr:zinc ABC transporter substrate-binding protein [Parabacteroides goldsteinii]